MTPEAYRALRRERARMAKKLIEHSHGHDPDCPDYDWEDLEELDQQLREADPIPWEES